MLTYKHKNHIFFEELEQTEHKETSVASEESITPPKRKTTKLAAVVLVVEDEGEQRIYVEIPEPGTTMTQARRFWPRGEGFEEVRGISLETGDIDHSQALLALILLSQGEDSSVAGALQHLIKWAVEIGYELRDSHPDLQF